MKDITEIAQNLLPVLAVAVTTSGLTTVSVQGVKNFLKVELKGNVARIATVLIALLWSYILAVHYGGGTYVDFALTFVMTFLGATGIYEVISPKKIIK